MDKSAGPHRSYQLQFLKLGGSLITAKSKPRTARLDVLARLAEEIAAAFQDQPGMRLVLGHGSGSFGHVPAKEYGTRQGVRTPQEWRGFAEVWWQASALNRLVMEALHESGLPAMAFQPSAGVVASDGRVEAWNLAPVQAALQAGLLPVVYGDVIFDRRRGGTILSTEDLFEHLAHELHPARILLAGIEPGVWADYPACTQILAEISTENIVTVAHNLEGAQAPDVTGGMSSKVRQSLALAQDIPGLEVQIFSGETPGMVRQALGGARAGTRIHD